MTMSPQHNGGAPVVEASPVARMSGSGKAVADAVFDLDNSFSRDTGVAAAVAL